MADNSHKLSLPTTVDPLIFLLLNILDPPQPPLPPNEPIPAHENHVFKAAWRRAETEVVKTAFREAEQLSGDMQIQARRRAEELASWDASEQARWEVEGQALLAAERVRKEERARREDEERSRREAEQREKEEHKRKEGNQLQEKVESACKEAERRTSLRLQQKPHSRAEIAAAQATQGSSHNKENCPSREAAKRGGKKRRREDEDEDVEEPLKKKAREANYVCTEAECATACIDFKGFERHMASKHGHYKWVARCPGCAHPFVVRMDALKRHLRSPANSSCKQVAFDSQRVKDLKHLNMSQFVERVHADA